LASGEVAVGKRKFKLSAWNRYDPAGVTYFDSIWTGRRLPIKGAQPAPQILPVEISNGQAIVRAPLTSVDERLPVRSTAIVLGSQMVDSVRRRILTELAPGRPLRVEVRLAPFPPDIAIGGYPQLVAGGRVVPNLASTHGTPRFLNDSLRRTAVGISRDGKSLILAVVDASDGQGMTLTEVAYLMQTLGTFQALNLDGSMSTAMAVAEDESTGSLRLATIANTRRTLLALGIVRDCSAKGLP
jgi:hypothetical protein